MKKYLKILITSSFLFVAVVLLNSPNVKAATEINLKKLDKLTEQALEEAELIVVTENEPIFKFTLDKASIVMIKNRMQERIGYNYRLNFYMDEKCTKEVVYTKYDGVIYSSDSRVFKRALEAGTYYLKGYDERNNYTKDEGKLELKIGYVEAKRDFKENYDFKNAKEIKVGKDINGFLTTQNSEHYYKIKVNKGSKLNISASFDNIGFSGMYVYLYDAKYKKLDDCSIPSTGVGELRKDLTVGTYYIKIDTLSKGKSGEYQFRADLVPLSLDAPSVKVPKANQTMVQGKGVRNAEVYVVCNGDTFIGTADYSGNYSIKTTKLQKNKNVKVYMIAEGIKSKIKTIKVK